MGDSIFRQKSIDKISSPDQLNDYVKVSSPGVWMVLLAIIILLIGVCVYGIFGRLDTKLAVAGVCENGTLTCYIKESDGAAVKSGMVAEVNGEKYTVNNISAEPIAIAADTDSYTLHIGSLQAGEWVYLATADAVLENGTYAVSIITESVSPLSFVVN